MTMLMPAATASAMGRARLNILCLVPCGRCAPQSLEHVSGQQQKIADTQRREAVTADERNLTRA
jgi:hypothetical protein